MTDKEILEILESEGFETSDNCDCAYIPGYGESTNYNSDYIVAEINAHTKTLQFFPEVYWDYKDRTLKTGCEKVILFYYSKKPYNSNYSWLDEKTLRTACRFVIKRIKDWQKVLERFSIEEEGMGFKYAEV